MLGTLRIEVDITFTVDSDVNGDSPQFTLTCVSTGGPATTVTWTRDMEVVTEGNETILVNGMRAEYNHTLTVIGRLEGHYKCTVDNEASSEVSKELNVQGMFSVVVMSTLLFHLPPAPYPPTDVTVSQNGLGSLLVSWTPPSGGATVTGYYIYYLHDGTLHSVTADASATNATITGLISRVTYSINVVANSTTLPSNVTTAPDITIGIL